MRKRFTDESEQTFFRCRNKFGGMDVSDAHRLKDLELENDRLMLVIDGMKEIVRKMTTPSGRRDALEALICRGLSQRKVCSYSFDDGLVCGRHALVPRMQRTMAAS